MQAPEWLFRDRRHGSKRLQIRAFGDAFAFVRSAGELGEAEFHHPDISLDGAMLRLAAHREIRDLS